MILSFKALNTAIYPSNNKYIHILNIHISKNLYAVYVYCIFLSKFISIYLSNRKFSLEICLYPADSQSHIRDKVLVRTVNRRKMTKSMTSVWLISNLLVNIFGTIDRITKLFREN